MPLMKCRKRKSPNLFRRIRNNQSILKGNTVMEPKSRLVYIILAIFLGGFGVHNFYAGYTKNAVIQLLLTLLLGWTVWSWCGSSSTLSKSRMTLPASR